MESAPLYPLQTFQLSFKKAFDRIHWEKMIKILRAYGIPPNLLVAIEATYTDTKGNRVTPDGTTDGLQLLVRVIERDTLAPFLFIIVLDYTVRKVTDDQGEHGFTVNPR